MGLLICCWGVILGCLVSSDLFPLLSFILAVYYAGCKAVLVLAD